MKYWIFLRKDAFIIDPFYDYDKERTVPFISVSEENYKIEFKGNYENEFYTASSNPKSLNLYLGLFSENNITKVEPISELTRQFEFGMKPKVII